MASLEARFEGYMYLSNEVASFLNVTKNIGGEIESKTARLNESIITRLNTRMNSLSEQMMARKFSIHASSTEGDLHRREQQNKPKSEALGFRSISSNQEDMKRKQEDDEGSRHGLSLSPTEKPAQVCPPPVSLNAGQKGQLKEAFEKRLEQVHRQLDGRMDAVLARAESERIRLDNLEAKLGLASLKLQSQRTISDLLTQLKANSEEIESAVKE